MSSKIINGNVIKNLPWEERPQGNSDILWRSERNPIIPRNLIPCSNSIFNSAVVPFGEGYAGVFRVDDKSRHLRLHSGKSKDAVNWEITHEPIQFVCEDEEIGKFNYGYDPRVCKIDDKYYVTWCNYYHGATIGMAYTYDFEAFYQMENAYLPFNRNGVLFPRKFNRKYAMLSRPSDNAHTPYGDIFYSESPDMVHWGCHRHVMSPTGFWQSKKVGPGPVPIETSEGWLLIYHGVMDSCNGFNYSMGAALLDLEKPWKVKYRTKPYILSPQKLYECVGDTPNIVFPCAALTDAETGKMAIYYGGADSVTCMAFGYIDELIDFIKANSI